jgi:hypothetical protein
MTRRRALATETSVSESTNLMKSSCLGARDLCVNGVGRMRLVVGRLTDEISACQDGGISLPRSHHRHQGEVGGQEEETHSPTNAQRDAHTRSSRISNLGARTLGMLLYRLLCVC